MIDALWLIYTMIGSLIMVVRHPGKSPTWDLNPVQPLSAEM